MTTKKGPADHSAKAGDTLLSIAHEYGFRTWQTIWEHPKNEALRKERKDPQVLAEGDKVHVPEKKPREFTVETNQVHKFVIKALVAHFRTVVRDEYGEPLANCKFELQIQGDDIDEAVLGGRTDEEGKIELQIHPKASRGKLEVWMGHGHPEKILTWNLQLGNLEPVSTTKGVKARLTNLGFLCGELNDDEKADEYVQALNQFQLVYKLPITGEADDVTRQKLLYIHDQR